MDDSAFERWSQALTTLRQKRQEEIDRNLHEKADSYKPIEFFELAHRSLDAIMEEWFGIEQESWQAAPPPIPNKALQTVKAEMESIVEFELQSIERDVTRIMSRVTWNPAELVDARKNFLPLAEEARKKYTLKSKSLVTGDTRSPIPMEPLRQNQYSASSGTGSGFAAIVMLFVGLLLGGGASVYFMNSRSKVEANFLEEKNKLLAQQRELADSMALLHSNFSDVVLGRSQTIPQLKAEMDRVQSAMAARVSVINTEAAGQRDRLRKRISDQNRLDRALTEVESDRLRRVKRVEDEYKPSMRVVEKRILLYQDLLGDDKKS